MHRRVLQFSFISLMSCKSSVMTASRQIINALPHTQLSRPRHHEGREAVNHSLLMVLKQQRVYKQILYSML